MFEHSLIDLDARKRSRRGREWLSLPVAVLIHLVALAAFTSAGYWQVDEVPEPTLNVVFYSAAPPPAPPPPRGSAQAPKPPAVKPPEAKPVPQQPVQPVPDQLPQTASPVVESVADLGPGDPRGSDNGVEGGDPDIGVDLGPGNGPIGAVLPAPTPVEERGPMYVVGAVKPPEFLVKTPPRYTEAARRAGVEGVVVLQAVIDEQGRVTDVKILRSLPMGLDQAALDAVRQWRLRPATLEGRPVKVYFNLTVNFKIQR